MNLGKMLGWSLLSIASIGLGGPLGCSSEAAPPDGGGGTAGTAGAAGGEGLDGALAADVSVEDASDGSAASDGADAEVSDALTDAPSDVGDGGSCDDCGAPRFTGDCSTAETACLANSACAAIRNCVFTGGDASAPCTLGPSGAACVAACIQANCTDAASGNLYRTLDQCAYCSACASPCSSYCGGFSDAGAATCGAEQ
jgi:hypothetical protein